MSKRKVVPYKNMPMNMPLWPSTTMWLMLDRLNAPGWLWGVCGTCLAVAWLCWVIDVCTRDPLDIYQ